MSNLRKLLTLKTKSKDKTTIDNETSSTDEKKTYLELGYQDSIDSNGSPQLFSQSLEDNYHKFKEQCRQDQNEQERLNAPLRQAKEKIRTELKKREVLKSIKEEERNTILESIHHIEDEIASVKTNPEAHGIDATKKPKAQFYIGLIILLPVTIYLVELNLPSGR